MESPEHERADIVAYFEMEHGEAKVEHAEKIASERIYGRPHDVWDIRSTDGRWWVITEMTNLYRQQDFPSMDHVISFHVGLMARITARQAQQADVSEEERDRLAPTWRKWEQAADALNHADEAEEFQAVGMRCREALLSPVRGTAQDEMVPEGAPIPKLGDFIHWSEYIAETVLPGASNARPRRYLKRSAAAVWDLVNWLTHAESAARIHAELTAGATQEVLGHFSLALVRHERPETLAQCPACSSYRFGPVYRRELDASVTHCAACGWEEPREADGLTPAS